MAAHEGTQRNVEFPSNGTVLRGWLRTPSRKGLHPLVILAHGLGGLKEWTIPEVADALVEAGIAAMALDYRNFGDSDGLPREEVDHYGRLDDWQNAISYATTLAEIDRDRIGIWGTSLGGRDVLAVAAIDRRLRRVISQVPLIKWEPGFAAWMAGFGTDLDRYYHELADDQRDRAAGKEPRYLDFESPDAEDDAAADQEYQATWGQEERRNYQGRVTLQTYRPTALTDMTALMPLIAPTPLLMLIADNDVLPGQRQAFDAAREPKSLVELKGHHYSLYTTAKPEAIAHARDWFVRHLVTA